MKAPFLNSIQSAENRQASGLGSTQTERRPPAAAAIADARASTAALQGFQALANNSSRVAQLKTYAGMATGGLPRQLTNGIEALSGMDVSDVRVHRNSDKPAQLNAHAYAQGNDIHLGPGQERHLPHEAWHVVQQRQGRVRATMQMAAVGVNDDAALEAEADRMGAQAMSAGASGVAQRVPSSTALSMVPHGAAPVQRKYELCAQVHVTQSSDHRAKSVRAENISGSTLGPAANSPSVSPFGWEALKTAGHTLANTSGNNSHYNAVRAHLMNGRLGGPGDATWNLAPAPAQINSQMSAGPETAAKNLVDAGHNVWLETTVSYHGNSSMATDFTSVVPNAIVMKWGTMDGKIKDAWSSAIELPVAPLQGAEALEYQNWDPAKPQELVVKLNTQSNQVRAQAFDLVTSDALKLAILHAYPQVYLSMERVSKGNILGALDPASQVNLLKAVGVYTSPDELIEEGVLPLAEAGKPMDAQALFATLDDSAQRATLIAWKNELLMHLGAIGDAWSIRDYTIFKYNGDITRAHLVNGMGDSTLKTFLDKRTKPERFIILDTWAEYIFLTGDNRAKNQHVSDNKKIPAEYRAEYAKAIGLRNRGAEYMAQRPTRARKTTGKFK